MEKKKVNSAYIDLNYYCTFAVNEKDYIHAVEWFNGEGVNVTISNVGGKEEKQFNLTWGEFDALKYLINTLDDMEGEEDEIKT